MEDEDSVRESTAEFLSENGYSVLKASGGPHALEIAERHTGPIDLLLTDLIMPQMSGRELSERIVRMRPGTRVVFMSGYSNHMLSNQQIPDPRHVLLQKPFRLESLGKVIRESLGPRRNAASGK